MNVFKKVLLFLKIIVCLLAQQLIYNLNTACDIKLN